MLGDTRHLVQADSFLETVCPPATQAVICGLLHFFVAVPQ
jgi:hypothetical protein